MSDFKKIKNKLIDIIPSELFHLNSKQTRSNFQFYDQVIRVQTDPAIKKVITIAYKKYPSSQKIPLKTNFNSSKKSFDEIIQTRHSIRTFDKRPISLDDVSKLLYHANGVTGKNTDDDNILHYFRTSPSAGGLHPIEIYLIAINVDGLTPGIYHYSPMENILETVSDQNPSEKFNDITFNQTSNISAVLVLTGIPGKSRFKYGERGYRFMMLEGGHISQNILLSANSLDLASYPMGGFVDDDVDELIGINGVDEVSLYMLLIGTKLKNTQFSKPKVKTTLE